MIRRLTLSLVLLIGMTASVLAADVGILNLTVDRGIPIALPGPASTVSVANPEVADVQVLSPTSIMVFGKRTGDTTVLATDSSGGTLYHRTLRVTQDLTHLRQAMDIIVPGHKIKVEAVPNGIALIGEAKEAAIVEDVRKLAMRYLPPQGEIVNRIKVRGSNQIHIRVRFAEVSRDIDKRFGIDWESIGSIGGIAFGFANGASVLSGGSIVGAGANLFNLNRPNDGGVLGLGYQNSRWNVNGMIDALAKDGFVSILAEPNLTALSGETASFLAGGEFPVPVPQSETTITIEWKKYGISLAFTPTLIGGDRMNLHVKPEVSQLSDVGAIKLDGFDIPALITRRAETTIELASGQSFAIGGLLNNNQQQKVEKYPFLGDMPILGQLFRSTRYQNNQSELVIIITPYIVKPVGEDKLSMPTDGFSPPSETDRLLNLRHSGSDPTARIVSGSAKAVKVEPSEAVSKPSEAELEAPKAAPVAPVTSSVDKPAVSDVSLSKASGKAAEGPVGPGGFILE